MRDFPNPFKWPNSLGAAVLGICAIILPVLWFGPWIPFVDLIAFVGLDSFPPTQSYGPNHYEVLQFTYILPMALSRICMDFNIGPSLQVPLFYLLQMFISFAVVWRIFEKLIANPLIKFPAIVLGSLVCWDGLFVWGGPFAYSLGAAFVALATYLSIREAGDPERTANWPVALLAILAVASHPFSLPFALVLFGARVIFLRKSRISSVGMIGLLLVYQVVIQRENPEPAPEHLLTNLFQFFPKDLFERIGQLFVWDGRTTYMLFGVESIWLNLFFGLIGTLRLLGFLGAAPALFLAKENRAIRMLAFLDLAIAALYFFARDNSLISMWPQRILTFHACLLYASGIVLPTYLWSRLRKPLQAAESTRSFPAAPVAWSLASLILAALFFVQAPLLRAGPAIEINLEAARKSLLDSGVQNAVIEVANYDLFPFYLRSIPFLLFSDAEVLKRNLIFYTEWHTQPRHPSRVAEMTLPSGRPHFTANFSRESRGLLKVQLTPK